MPLFFPLFSSSSWTSLLLLLCIIIFSPHNPSSPNPHTVTPLPLIVCRLAHCTRASITQERRNYFAKTFNSLRIRTPGHLAGLVKALVSSIQSGPHTVTGIEQILEKKWKKCSSSNCQTKANKGGLCVKHGSRGICCAAGCTNKARVRFRCNLMCAKTHSKYEMLLTASLTC